LETATFNCAEQGSGYALAIQQHHAKALLGNATVKQIIEFGPRWSLNGAKVRRGQRRIVCT
jgi:hypothetical protein